MLCHKLSYCSMVAVVTSRMLELLQHLHTRPRDDARRYHHSQTQDIQLHPPCVIFTYYMPCFIYHYYTRAKKLSVCLDVQDWQWSAQVFVWVSTSNCHAFPLLFQTNMKRGYRSKCSQLQEAYFQCPFCTLISRFSAEDTKIYFITHFFQENWIYESYNNKI